MPSNLMQRGLALSARLHKLAGGRTVGIYRSGVLVCEVTGWAEMQEFDVVNRDGINTKATSLAWRFLAADLTRNDELFMPRAGDVLKETLEEAAKEYTVAPPSADVPAVTKPDTFDKMLTVHTKLTKSA